MSNQGKPPPGKPKRRHKNSAPPAASHVGPRIRFVGVACIIALAGLVGRIGYLKITYGEKYEQKAIEQLIAKNANVEQFINPNRGAILDRNHMGLAVSDIVYKIIFDPKLLFEDASAKQQNESIQALADTFGLSAEELRGYIAKDPETGKAVKDSHYVVVKQDVPPETALALDEKHYTGIFIEKDSKRNYVHNTLAAQTIGFIRGDSKWGLEAQYDDVLTGEPGRLFRTYSGEGSPTTQQIASRDGYSLVTTLDLTIQQYAEKAALEAGTKYEAQHASVVVMNPMTGEVLGMANYPSFDPNDPGNVEKMTDPNLKASYDQMSEEDKANALYNVWRNYDVSNTFEPGSIFKPVVVAAALEENIITPNTPFYCGGAKTINGVTIPCWYTSGHGPETLTQVLANSCNVGMMDIIEQLGKDKFYKYRKDFGFGEKTGIDLPAEESVSSPLVMYGLDQLIPVNLATSAMGQGFNNTAVQAVNAFSAVINGGNLMKPYVVSQVIDSDGKVISETQPTVQRKVISKETSDYMRMALGAVVSPTGTGKKAVIKGYAIGGKTGTAQQGPRKDEEYTVSFMAYLPVENPQIIACVIIDRPKEYIEGSTSAAPMMRQVLMDIIRYKGIPPTGETNPADNLNSLQNSFELKDYVGQNLSDVTADLNKQGLDYEFAGSGSVVKSTMPNAGTVVDSTSKIYLYIGSGENDELIQVPSVVGSTPDQAADLLTNAGLVPFIVETGAGAAPASGDMEPSTANIDPNETANPQSQASAAPADRVIVQQMPSAELRVCKGTQIRLKVEAASQSAGNS